MLQCACRSCGATNRIPVRRLTDTARCGACKAPLKPVGDPIDADQALLDEIVAGARVPVLVDFWAPWCGSRRMVAPEVKALARFRDGKRFSNAPAAR